MFILAATDLSESSKGSTHVAAALAKRLKMPLHLHHCSMEFRLAGDHEVPFDEETNERLQSKLAAEAEAFRKVGVEVIAELRYGMPSFEIFSYACKNSPKYIVIGATASNLAELLLMGSLAESAPAPVLMVREPESLLKWLNESAPLRVLCGFDFTVSAENAVMATRPIVDLGAVEFEAANIRTSQNRDFNQDPLARQIDVWEELKDRLGDVPIRVHVRDVEHLPAGEFLSLAEERQPGLLVLGTHRKDEWSRIWESSFSRRVFTHAHTNVLCVPDSAPGGYHIPQIRRVLVATNLDAPGLDALRYAHALLPDGGKIHVLHVCLATVPPQESRIKQSVDEAIAKLNALPQSLLSAPDKSITTEVACGSNVAEAVHETAENMGADVICLATKGHSRIGAAVLGSTFQALLKRSHIPVLAVTPPVP